MFGATSILDIGRTGLTAAQTGISVTSENISNVDTEGYSRRTVVFEEAYNIDYQPGQVGTGVWAAAIQRNFDQYIENQYNNQATMRDRWETVYTKLQGAESLFNESSGYGISNSITNFFNSWDDLTQQPAEASSRSQVVQSAQTLISTLHQADQDLTLMQNQADLAITQQVGEVNALVKQIAEINKQINIHSSENNTANNLLDTRNTMVRKLAGYLDINYIDKGSGNVTITTKAGQTLVDNSDSFTLSYDAPQATPALTASSAFTGNAYFSGTDNMEYTVDVLSSGPVSSGASAATYRLSTDGGKTWLTNPDGTTKVFSARPQSKSIDTGNISIWFGDNSDPSAIPSTNLTVGDRFNIVPKRGLYWNENTSSKENITPNTNSSGVDNSSRLVGGTLTALFNFKDDYVGSYREKMDAIAKSTAWEVNRIHSQGAGLVKLTETMGSYSVSDDTRALASGSSGLEYGSKLTSGSAMMYIYNTSTGKLVSGAALDFDKSSGLPQLNFDPNVNTLNDVAQAVNDTFGTYVTATIINHKLSISAKDGYSFSMGTDTTGIYAALGLNTFFTGSNCQDLGINDKITTDADNLATGHVNGAGETNSGDITTATAIAGLKSKAVDITTIRNGTVSESIVKYYDGLVGTVGADTAQAKFNYTYKNTLASDLNDQQQAVSGVSLDEEMTSLIKYQHAYTAAAKLITTADQMLQTLLSLKS